jgi:hypothetical protein
VADADDGGNLEPSELRDGGSRRLTRFDFSKNGLNPFVIIL